MRFLVLLGPLALSGCFESHGAAILPPPPPPDVDAGRAIVCDDDRYYGDALASDPGWWSLYEGCDDGPIIVFRPRDEPHTPESLEAFRDGLGRIGDVSITLAPCCPSRADSPTCVVWPLREGHDREAFDRGDYEAVVYAMWLIGASDEQLRCTPIRRPLR